LLDEVSAALRHLPEVAVDNFPRLTDFCRILAALDVAHSDTSPPTSGCVRCVGCVDRPSAHEQPTDTTEFAAKNGQNTPLESASCVRCVRCVGRFGPTVTKYLRQDLLLAQSALEADAFATAIQKLIADRDRWEGTATDLLSALPTPRRASDSDWPRSPRGVTPRLDRLLHPFKSIGIDIDYYQENGTNSRRMIRIESTEPLPK
jgi:hypothetical protein